MGQKTNRTSLVSRDSAMIAGVQKHFKGATVTLLGQKLTDVQLVSGLQADIDAENGVAPAKAAFQLAVQTAVKQRASSREQNTALRQLVVAMFRTQPDVLSDFGIVLKSRTKLTSEQAAQKAAKAKATREARHTLGPVQKKSIKGTLPKTDVSETTSSVTNGSSTTPKNG